MDVKSLITGLNRGREAAPRESTETKVVQGPALDPTTWTPPGTPDIYHGTDDPVSQSLLAQSGVNAYSTLLNVGRINELYDQSVDQLTEELPQATVGLVLSYHAAVTSLSSELQQKDWGFSISNGRLVFKQGTDELSEHELAQLQKAFADVDVEYSADRAANAVVSSIELRRESGHPTGTLAWGRFKVDRTNFSEVVDLREYVTSIMPGGKYNQWSVNPQDLAPLQNVTAPRAMIDLIAANAEALPSK